MVLEEFRVATGKPRRPWRTAIRLRCDRCGAEFVKDVNVRRWRAAARHRCSLGCFVSDDAAHEARRRTCLERYAVPSVVVRPDVLAANAKRRASVARYWKETDLQLTRGLVIKRSRAEIDFVTTLSAEVGEEAVAPKQVNGWFIDAFFPRRGFYLQFDGVHWHFLPGRADVDREQDAWFAERGLRLLRVTDVEWRKDRKGTLERVLRWVSGVSVG